jgi:hypothetical protein
MPEMLISRIHGSHFANFSEFCTAEASMNSATIHSATPITPKTVEPYLRIMAGTSRRTSRNRDASR